MQTYVYHVAAIPARCEKYAQAQGSSACTEKYVSDMLKRMAICCPIYFRD